MEDVSEQALALEQELLSITEVAARTGLKPSALRFYEDAGLIVSATRISGRRHFEPTVLHRLSVVALLQETGFTIAEIVALLRDEPAGTQRWRTMAEGKLAELETHIERAKAARQLLEAALDCGCGQLDRCELADAAAARRMHARLDATTAR